MLTSQNVGGGTWQPPPKLGNDLSYSTLQVTIYQAMKHACKRNTQRLYGVWCRNHKHTQTKLYKCMPLTNMQDWLPPLLEAM